MATTISVGSSVYIPAGTKVTRAGVTTKRTSDTYVTVRTTESTRTGKTRVSWKSNGVRATAVLG